MRKHLAAFFAVAILVLVPSAMAFASYTWTDSNGSDAAWYTPAMSDSGLIVYASQADPDDPHTAPLMKSIDGGVNWSALNFNYTGDEKSSWRSVSTSADGTIVAAIGYDAGEFVTKIRLSNDGGSSFTAVDSEREWMNVAVAGDGNTIVAVEKEGSGYSGGVWKWTRSSNSWTAITPTNGNVPINGDWRSVAISTDGKRIVAALDNSRLFVSANGGVTWANGANSTSGNWVSAAMSGDGRYIVATLDGGVASELGAWVSSDFGVTWQRRLTDGGLISAAISRDGSTMAISRYPRTSVTDAIFMSYDGGVTWTVDAGTPSASWTGVALSASGERLLAVPDSGRPVVATSTTTTTTTVAPATSEAPATTEATTTSTTTTSSLTSSSSSTTAAPATTVAATTTTTVVDSPPPAVTPSMVETFKPKPLVKQEQVAAGETVTVRISGFQPFELVTIGFDDSGAVTSQAAGDSVRAFAGRKVLLTVRADATGTISVQAKLPTTVSGAVTLWAYGRESKVGFRQKFTVAELPKTGGDGFGINLTLSSMFVGSGVVLFGLRRRLRR